MSLLGCTFPNCSCEIACEGLHGLSLGKGRTPEQQARARAVTGSPPTMFPLRPVKGGQGEGSTS
jgi:hypothetical protein